MSNGIENLLEPRPDKGGRLFIKGTRISLNFIAREWRAGFGAEEIIENYPHIPPEGVYAALAFYFANRKKVDADVKKEIAEERRLIQKHARLEKENEKQAA